MDAMTQRAIEAQQQLDHLLESEAAYKFMAGCAKFMSEEGLRLLQDAAKNGQRWAFRLLVDAMKVLAKVEMARAASAGRRTAPPVRMRTGFAKDGDKV